MVALGELADWKLTETDPLPVSLISVMFGADGADALPTVMLTTLLGVEVPYLFVAVTLIA